MSSWNKSDLIDLRRDAFQRYHLIHHYIKSASRTWDLTVFIVLLVSLLSFILYLYNVFIGISDSERTSRNASLVTISWVIFALITFFFPTACIAYTNTATTEIIRSLKFSQPCPSDEYCSKVAESRVDEAKEDFQVIGGRSEWLQYVTENPIQWTVYGFPITTSWLQTFMVGAASTLLISLLPILIG